MPEKVLVRIGDRGGRSASRTWFVPDSRSIYWRDYGGRGPGQTRLLGVGGRRTTSFVLDTPFNLDIGQIFTELHTPPRI